MLWTSNWQAHIETTCDLLNQVQQLHNSRAVKSTLPFMLFKDTPGGAMLRSEMKPLKEAGGLDWRDGEELKSLFRIASAAFIEALEGEIYAAGDDAKPDSTLRALEQRLVLRHPSISGVRILNFQEISEGHGTPESHEPRGILVEDKNYHIAATELLSVWEWANTMRDQWLEHSISLLEKAQPDQYDGALRRFCKKVLALHANILEAGELLKGDELEAQLAQEGKRLERCQELCSKHAQGIEGIIGRSGLQVMEDLTSLISQERQKAVG